MRYVVGIDIGGTNLVVGCVAEDGSALHGLMSEPTLPESGADDRHGAPAHAGAALHRRDPGHAAEREIAGVGVGASRPLDRSRGVVLLTPNLGWTNMPLRERVSEGSTCMPHSTTTRTARCSANGGSGPRRARAMPSGITIGTGIGGGLIVNGEMVHGASDCAGEIGHVTIETRAAAASAATTAASRPTRPVPRSHGARSKRWNRAA
jgi:glucokinase